MEEICLNKLKIHILLKLFHNIIHIHISKTGAWQNECTFDDKYYSLDVGDAIRSGIEYCESSIVSHRWDGRHLGNDFYYMGNNP